MSWKKESRNVGGTPFVKHAQRGPFPTGHGTRRDHRRDADATIGHNCWFDKDLRLGVGVLLEMSFY
jgi:hypothetical protein